MPATMDFRSNAQRHADAAQDVDAALRALRRAATNEGDLDFGPTIAGRIEELEEMSRRMKAYAANGW